MDNNHKSIQQLESELFAVTSTINKLYEKFQKAKINNDFFQKSFKNSVYELIKIKVALKKKHIHLSEIITEKEFVREYNKAIFVIDKISKNNYYTKDLFRQYNDKSSKYSNLIESSILNLPGITSEITSSFITLMDAIKLDVSVGTDFILDLFKGLKNQIIKFPGLDNIVKKFDKLYKHVSHNINTFQENYEYREKLVDHLYNLFKEFQEILSLKL